MGTEPEYTFCAMYQNKNGGQQCFGSFQSSWSQTELLLFPTPCLFLLLSDSSISGPADQAPDLLHSTPTSFSPHLFLGRDAYLFLERNLNPMALYS